MNRVAQVTHCSSSLLGRAVFIINMDHDSFSQLGAGSNALHNRAVELLKVDVMRCPFAENISAVIQIGSLHVDLEASIAAMARFTPRSQPRLFSRWRDCGEREGNERLLAMNLSGELWSRVALRERQNHAA